MTYNPDLHHRRSIRLKGYDYSKLGAYFITICTHNKACLFGSIANHQMQFNDLGKSMKMIWQQLPVRFSNLTLDISQIMPNHIHGIVLLDTLDKPNHGLPDIIRVFKSLGTRYFRSTSPEPLWQKNYWERIIRDEQELHRTRTYILNNPAHWDEDKYHPDLFPNP